MKRELEELIADLPIEIVKPVVEDLYKSYRCGPQGLNTGMNKTRTKYPNISVMARDFGVQERTIWSILEGERNSVTLEICDRITNKTFTYDLDTLYHSAKQWARKNPDRNWPQNYLPGKKNGKKKKTVKKKVVA